MKTGPANFRWIYALGILSVLFYAVDRSAFRGGSVPAGDPALRASRLMAGAIDALRPCAAGHGVVVDPSTDLNRTALIGLEDSPITTSLGQIEAKRTSVNPNFAGCIARMFGEGGVDRGDAVAIGASSSFPAMILATLAAVEAIGAKPVMIGSLGASNWGANNPAFTQLEILDCLRSAGLFDVRPAALAVGGEKDDGSDMSDEGRAIIREKIRLTGLPVIEEPDLASNVRARMAVYETGAAGKRIAAFVNIGGSWANMGVDPSILELRPGLTEVNKIPPREKRGVIQEMASRGVPVIHLLFIRGLAERCGLPWDPVPLPEPDEIKNSAAGGSIWGIRTILIFLYIVISAAILIRIGFSDRLTET
jgi:poly-gamma-glutamate system protein